MSFLYKKTNENGNKKSFLFGMLLSYKKKTADGYIDRRLFGLWKTEKRNNTTTYYIRGLRIWKKTDWAADINSRIDCLQRTVNPLQVETDVDNILLKINRLIMTDISTAFLHKETFEPFRGSFRGKKVALICTAPSLNNFSPELLDKDMIYVGVNAAYKKMKLNFLFCQDYFATSPYFDEILKYNPSDCKKFFGQIPDVKSEYGLNVPETAFFEKNVYKYKIDFVDKYYRRTPSFLPVDITTQPLGDWGSIAASAMQFILFGCPDTVYIVGCDCTKNHFEEKFDVIKDVDLSFLAAIFWPALKRFKNTYYPKMEIISVNPVGLKGLFHDVYTESYLADHPEIDRNSVEILNKGE